MSYGLEEYRQLIGRFAELARGAVPEGATVVVVSKGDAALLEVGDRQTWHFPQRSDGTYAGYHPLDSASAISHLEELRERGARYLAFPAPSIWWLDHYKGLRQHLESHYRAVSEDPNAGIIYALDPAATNGAAATPKAPAQQKKKS